MNKRNGLIALTIVAGFVGMAGFAVANASRDAIMQSYGSNLSAAAGKAFFLASPGTGEAATPSCITCHTPDPTATGRTRVGKPIAPMAVSRTPDRFTDAAKVEKWFLRNCRSVLGRECTSQEKGDYIAYMNSI